MCFHFSFFHFSHLLSHSITFIQLNIFQIRVVICKRKMGIFGVPGTHIWVETVKLKINYVKEFRKLRDKLSRVIYLSQCQHTLKGQSENQGNNYCQSSEADSHHTVKPRASQGLWRIRSSTASRLGTGGRWTWECSRTRETL